jgi:hypothetical protein
MSKRTHFGGFHHPYVWAFLFCKGVIETSYDWESISHYDMTDELHKVTCKTCISELSKLDDETLKMLKEPP